MKRKRINPGKRLRLRIDPADLARFLAKVKVDPESGCWEWTAYCDPDGYPQFKLNGEKDEAHRVSYAVFVRTISDGRDIDHRCRNRKCDFYQPTAPTTDGQQPCAGGWKRPLFRRMGMDHYKIIDEQWTKANAALAEVKELAAEAPFSDRVADLVARFKANQAGCEHLRKSLADYAKTIGELEQLLATAQQIIGHQTMEIRGLMAAKRLRMHA